MALALLLLFAGCSPTAPNRFAISGRVRLVGFLVNADGTFAGTRVVDDASGVPVELVSGTSVVGRTATAGGTWRFAQLAPSSYRVRTRVVDSVADSTGALTVANLDVAVGAPLELRSYGDLTPVPNPSADTVAAFFRVTAGGPVDLRVRGMGGGTTRALVSQMLPAGYFRVIWDGRDDAGHPVTPALYWLTFESGSDSRAHLLFR